MSPTRKLPVEMMERIIKLQEGNPSWSVAKEVGSSQSAASKIWCKYKQKGKVIKEKQADQGRHQSIEIENSKQFALKIENAQ